MANRNHTQARAKHEFIKNAMTKLDISHDEAEQLWKFDHDEVTAPEVEAIEQKIEDKKPVRKENSPINKVKNLKAKKKADSEKEAVLEGVFNHIMAAEFAVAPQQISTTKVSFKGVDGGWYTVTVTKNKSKPDGYKED